MAITTERHAVSSGAEVVNVRHVVRKCAVELGFSLVDQTKIVTAASEIARNMVDYGGGGTLTVEAINETARTGLRLIFEDQGPGIRNVDEALRDGFTTGGGLGLGLGGAKRLSDEFKIETAPGSGTRITLARWKRR